MRNTFIKSLIKEAKTNKNIVLLVGDVGYSVVEEFQKNYPDRFFNAGIAEQNMASMAAGLASSGFHVFIYSIANFPTFRCAEQIRNDIGYHNLPVTIVSVGAGVAYGSLGYSHHAIQDLGLMRLFPEFLIATPGDPIETAACLKYIFRNPSPSYLRLKKAGDPNFNIIQRELTPGTWNKVLDNEKSKIFLTTSGGLKIALDYIKREEFSNFGIYSCPLWGARNKDIQQEQLDKFDEIITIEDHLLDCGFGSWLRESISDLNTHTKVKCIGFNQNIIGKVGSESYLQNEGGV